MKFILKKSKKKFGDFIIKNFHIFYINTKYVFLSNKNINKYKKKFMLNFFFINKTQN